MSKRVDKYSKRGTRNSSISTVIGISLVLFMIGLVFGIELHLNDLQKKTKETLEGDVFFKPNLNEADIKQIEIKLKSWKELKKVTYVSPEAAIALLGFADEELKEIYNEEAIIPPSITFSPKEKHANKDGMEKIKSKITTSFPNQIEEISYEESLVESANIGFKRFQFLTLAIAIILILIAVAIINNTIRLALYSKRFTIKTMQLVGARSGFIRRPFLIGALFQGVLSAIFGMTLLVTFFYSIQKLSFEVLSESPPTKETFLILFLLLLLFGVLITFISTWFALNKFLKTRLDNLY